MSNFVSNKIHESIRVSLDNFDKNMKVNGKKLKELMDYSNQLRIDNPEEPKLRTSRNNSSKPIFEEPSINCLNNITNKLTYSQNQIFNLIKQYKDFESSFQHLQRLNLAKSNERSQLDAVDSNGTLNGNETDYPADLPRTDEIDIFSLDPNSFMHFPSMKKFDSRKKTTKKNTISNYKQSWQLKVLSKKMGSMKRDIVEMKDYMEKMEIFKEKIKKTLNELESKVLKLNKTNERDSNCNKMFGDLSNKSFRLEFEDCSENFDLSYSKSGLDSDSKPGILSDDISDALRLKFDKVISINEGQSSFLVRLLDLLQIIISDDQRMEVIERLQEIASVSSSGDMKFEYLWQDSIGLSGNPIEDPNIKLVANPSASAVSDNLIDCNRYSINCKIRSIIDLVDQTFQINIHAKFDYSLKENIYQKILVEFERIINEELSTNRIIDSKMLFNEINNRDYSDFLRNYLSHGIWSCLSSYDNFIVKDFMEDAYKNLTEFLLKHLKSIISISEKINKPQEHSMEDFHTFNNSLQFINAKDHENNCDENCEYLTEKYFPVQNNSISSNEGNVFNVLDNSLNQLDAEEKDWIGQADKKESNQNLEDF